MLLVGVRVRGGKGAFKGSCDKGPQKGSTIRVYGFTVLGFQGSGFRA